MLLGLGLVAGGAAAYGFAGSIAKTPEQARSVRIVGIVAGVAGALLLLDELAGGFLGLFKRGTPKSATDSVIGDVTDAVFGPTEAGPYASEPLPEGSTPMPQYGGNKLGGVAVGGTWVKPLDGQDISRNPFSSKVDVTVEITNNTDEEQGAYVEVQLEVFRTFADTTRHNTALGTYQLAPKEVRRVSGLVETGDLNIILFETGAGTASASLVVNGFAVSNIVFGIS